MQNHLRLHHDDSRTSLKSLFGRSIEKLLVEQLDVGCGVGHWGRILAPFLSTHCHVVGVDRETTWVKQATLNAQQQGLSQTYRYQQADAQCLPFEEHCFDAVTCQTLLIHVAKPEQVLDEMCRVLSPGGILIAVEPNNLARNLVLGNMRFDWSTDEILALTKFQMLCEQGKINLGLGDNSLGDNLPAYFSAAGLTNISTYLSDKAFSYQPPYHSPTETNLIAEAKKRLEQAFWIWSKAALAMRFQKKIADNIDSNSYVNAGGNICYLVSGIKAF